MWSLGHMGYHVRSKVTRKVRREVTNQLQVNDIHGYERNGRLSTKSICLDTELIEEEDTSYSRRSTKSRHSMTCAEINVIE